MGIIGGSVGRDEEGEGLGGGVGATVGLGVEGTVIVAVVGDVVGVRDDVCVVAVFSVPVVTVCEPVFCSASVIMSAGNEETNN